METRIGDIFAVRLKRKGVYFVAQILGGGDEAGYFALVLDGFTSAPPSLKEATKLKPFYFDHHFWKRGEFYLGTDKILDAEPVFIGNAASICEPSKCVRLQTSNRSICSLRGTSFPRIFALNLNPLISKSLQFHSRKAKNSTPI